MQAVVIYESLTGNTARAGKAIAEGLTAEGLPTQAFPITNIDYQALSDADLVVVGSKGRGAVSRMLVGSVTDRLVHISKKPVLVVR